MVFQQLTLVRYQLTALLAYQLGNVQYDGFHFYQYFISFGTGSFVT